VLAAAIAAQTAAVDRVDADILTPPSDEVDLLRLFAGLAGERSWRPFGRDAGWSGSWLSPDV